MSFENEIVVETKVCQKCQTNFDISDKDLEFYDKVSPIFKGRKYSIPIPQLCPECRQIRRLAWRNERNLYKRTCDSSGESIVSTCAPNTDYTVFKTDIWFSDSWDPLDYGVDFDFSRGFFEQFDSLFKKVPMLGLLTIRNEASEYVSYSADIKNCYMIFASSRNQDCMYSRWIMNNAGVVDSNNISFSQDLYECLDSKNINNCFYCIGAIDSHHCFGCYDIIGCSDCIGCSNLRNKQYCIFNTQYSKDEYEIEKNKLILDKNILLQAQKNGFYRWAYSLNDQNTTGEYVIDTKNIVHGFDIEQCENCKYVSNILDMKDSVDIDFQAFNTQLCYDSIAIENVTKCCFNFGVIEGSHVMYCYLLIASSDCFGCVGLRNKQYCIFNKQYSKGEYEKLVPRIIEHMQTTQQWGEFFPSSLSPFGYNETISQEYFPLTRAEAQSKGFNWSDYEAPFLKVTKTILARQLPDNISDIPDDILDWAIECEMTKKPFRIVKQELEFYRKHNLPIPKRHPDQRHSDRLNSRNPRKLFKRDCDKCKVEINTTYTPGIKKIVYCESCYNKKVY